MLFLTKPMAVLLAVIPLSGLDCDWFAADKVFVSTDYLSAEAFDILLPPSMTLMVSLASKTHPIS